MYETCKSGSGGGRHGKLARSHWYLARRPTSPSLALTEAAGSRRPLAAKFGGMPLKRQRKTVHTAQRSSTALSVW
jgi:hypothetical protein